MMITVRAKITAGIHPVHGAIIKGHEYRIDVGQMADQLFELVENRGDTQEQAEIALESLEPESIRK